LLLVYDVTDWDSFEKVPAQVEEMRTHAPNAPWILVGNKSDLFTEWKVTTEEGQMMAMHYNVGFMETSAK